MALILDVKFGACGLRRRQVLPVTFRQGVPVLL